MTALLFLDLDSTVRKGYDELGRFVNGPEDVEVFGEAVTMMRRWREAGGRIVGVSNQGGVGLGHVTAEQVSAAVTETRRQADDLFDLVLYCAHAPDEGCACRKPQPGLLAEAVSLLSARHGEDYPVEEALMVGDRDEDADCAANAGVRFLWAADWREQG